MIPKIALGCLHTGMCGAAHAPATPRFAVSPSLKALREFGPLEGALPPLLVVPVFDAFAVNAVLFFITTLCHQVGFTACGHTDPS